ncbi:MAG: 3-oxoacyl-[acyl-carrier-protein] reductase [Thermodesulfovibrionales bacterium]
MKHPDKKEKVALVTGGSRGLGRAICLRLAQAGHTIIVNYRSSGKESEAVVREAGGAGFACQADVGYRDQVDAMVREVEKRYGRLDAVVNNAGITHDRLLVRQTEAEWDEVIRTNLTGCVHLIQAAAPLLAESGGGHILNISSYSGLHGSAGQAAYSASKAALFGLAFTAAQELGSMNIRVNCLLPGYLPTDLGRGNDAALAKARERSIMKSLSSLDDAAAFVAYILSTESVTGQVFTLDSRIS